MPQVLKPLCPIQFWSWTFPFSSVLALWGNKNWPPSMKVQKIENWQNEMGLKGCKWFSLNILSTQTLEYDIYIPLFTLMR